MNTIDTFDKYVAKTYGRFNVSIDHGIGSLLYDENGKEYIDLGSGIAVNIFGAADKEWTDAVTSQLTKISHTSNLYYTAPQGLLAKKLCEMTGLKKVFFGNSGAEANECAIKVARKYSFDKYGEGRNKIVTLQNSFHGRTVTTLAATGQDSFHNYFFPFTEGFEYAKANDIEETLTHMDDKCCAIMIEVVQGEGGVIPLRADYVKAIADKCQIDDILLIVDEVQTGNGRTGKMYGYQNFDILPDVVTTAKGLGGGLPIGATLLGEKVKDTLVAGTHGSTFGGNPTCAAGALNIVSRIDEKLLSEVKEKSQYIIETLSKLKNIESVTGMGLMLGIKTTKDSKEVVNKCIEKGVLVLSAKDKIRLVPALNIPFEALKKAIKIISEVIEE